MQDKNIFSTGWSSAPTASEAVAEAYEAAASRLYGRPSLIICYASYNKYPNPYKLEGALRSVAGGAPFIAVSTAGEYVDGEALTGSLVLALFSDKVFRATVAAAEAAQDDPARAGERLASRLPGRGVVLLHSAPGREEELLASMRIHMPPDLLLVGGSSGDDFQLKPPLGYQVSSEASGTGIAVAASVEAMTRIIIVGGHACSPAGRYGVATRVEGPRGERIVEIDSRDAVEVYSSWVGVDVGRVEAEMLSLGLANPLAVYDPVTGRPYIKHPAFAKKGEGITCFASIPAKQTIHLMRHDREAAVELPAKLASRTIPATGCAGALLIHCAGASAYIGGDGRRALARRLAEELKAPFVGFSAYGEQWGYYDYGIWPAHQNLTAALMVFLKP